MKVYIGPYIDWIGPYQIADMVFFWIPRSYNEKLEDQWDYKLRDKFGDWLSKTWVNNLCEWIYNKKQRKIKIKIDKYDSWSADHTLALIALPLLKQLQQTQHGAPWTDDEDVPEELRSTSAPPKENEWDTDENHHKRWEWILNEIIWAFEEHCNEDGDFKFSFNQEEYKACIERKRNGFKLFGKYYQSLWD